ncbi:MAG TPA: glycosyltransferase family 4 protein [Verrucomicrobiota bacterium]|nr:glycosyltransferase family 4 protein [Verrucomicrobiota bacterium]
MTDSLLAPHGTPQLSVIFVTTVFKDVRTGPAVYARYLWDAFRDDPEIEFHVVAPEFPEAHPRWHASGCVSGGFGFYRALCRAAGELVRQLGSHTLLHTNNCHTGASLLALGVPVIGQINDYENTDVVSRILSYLRLYGVRRCAALLWRRRLERFAVRRQALTVCNSEHTRRKVLGAYHPPSHERVITVYKAVDLDRFRRPPTLPPDPLARPEDRARLLFVGADFRRKGLDTLVDALSLLPETRLDVIGLDSVDFVRAYPRLATAAGCSRVQFHGRQPPDCVCRALWHSDVFVMPSRAEALGVAILEALAAGLPVVAGRVGGIPEIMTHPDCGELVVPGNPQAVAAAVSRGLSDRRGRPGPRPAVEAILERFSRKAMIEQVRRLYLSHAVR